MASYPPEKIYLQWHGDGEPDDLGEVSEHDVTWCRNKIFNHDIEYVSASEIARLREAIKTHAEKSYTASTIQHHQRLNAELYGYTLTAIEAANGECLAEIIRLRKAIEDAPHSHWCCLVIFDDGDCNCWKAAALKDKP